MLLTRPASSALLAALRGGPAPPAPAPELTRRAHNSDEREQVVVRSAARAAAGTRLAAAAMAREAVLVVLADGSALALDDAERLLARKEERGPHRTLRSAIDASLDQVRHLIDYGYEPSSAPVGVEAFLAATGDLAGGALAALETLGGAAIEDAPALAWALDLPAPAFQEAPALAIVAAVRAAAGVNLRSVRVPRLLAGVVLVDDEVRFGLFPGLQRAHRFCRTVEGGLTGLAQMAVAAPGVGAAMTLGALTPAALRIAGLSRSDAERCARIAMACAVLHARAAAALLVAGWPDALELAVPRPMRPTAALRELLEEPVYEERSLACARLLDSAAIALTMRAQHDEAFAVSASAWRDPAPGTSMSPADAWRTWAGPWL